MYKLKNHQQFMTQLLKFAPMDYNFHSKCFYDDLDVLIDLSYTNHTYQITIPKDATPMQCEMTMTLDKDSYVQRQIISSDKWIYLHSGCVINPNESYIITTVNQSGNEFATELSGSTLQTIVDDLVADRVDYTKSIKVIKKTSSYFIDNIINAIKQSSTKDDQPLEEIKD